jgi:hypothetical protein
MEDGTARRAGYVGENYELSYGGFHEMWSHTYTIVSVDA